MKDRKGHPEITQLRTGAVLFFIFFIFYFFAVSCDWIASGIRSGEVKLCTNCGEHS